MNTLNTNNTFLKTVSEESKGCIKNLVDYLAVLEQPDFSSYPKTKLAAVLVLLYEQDGVIRVLLSTRSKELRTHAGQTALPGGKREVMDADLIETALREAREEVSLPVDCQSIWILGTLEPFISQHKLLVTPVIAFLGKSEVIALLKPSQGEVSHIFSHPLRALLDPALANSEELVPIGSENWPYETVFHNASDVVWQMLESTAYRMHRFRTSASPIKGLTADILIKTAEIAYAELTTYERFAPGQLRKIKDIVDIIQQSTA